VSSQLERDIRAAVEFLAEDPWRWFKALNTHFEGSHGWCAAHTARHPCLTFRLASFAEQLYRERVSVRVPIPREGQP